MNRNLEEWRRRRRKAGLIGSARKGRAGGRQAAQPLSSGPLKTLGSASSVSHACLKHGPPSFLKEKRHRPSMEKRPSCENNHPTTTASGAKGIMASSESDFMQKSGESIWSKRIIIKAKNQEEEVEITNNAKRDGLTIQLKKYWLILRFNSKDFRPLVQTNIPLLIYIFLFL